MLQTGRKGSAMIFAGVDQPIEQREAALPQPGPGEVLVEITYATICRSDLHTVIGKRTEDVPLVLGHECVGRIVALHDPSMEDARGRQLSLGNLVTWSVFAAPDDEWSDRGLPQKSPAKIKYGHLSCRHETMFSGGFASHILLREGTVIIQVAAHIDVRIWAPVNCSLATVVGAFRIAGAIAGKRIAIYGSGMLGMHALAFARTQKAAHITVLDPNRRRLERALAFKADHIIQVGQEQADTIDQRYDLVLETSGSVQAMEHGIDQLQIGGTAVWVGAVFPQEKLRLDSEQIVRKILTIRGLHNYNAADLIAAVEHIEQAATDFPFRDLVEAEFYLSDLNKALQYALEANPLRVGVRPNLT